ncbi:MAG TPA: phage tail sheath C-terminal domain-containing protein [Saprospiraceae bacterium]|nr:phage tail sheath C-terminal domain-containing protein [Saprospiraceae bacterium]
MATTYKTPGVYVEEIPKFPPSIAAVETAIPAFIGYTEKAIRNGQSLLEKSIRIESIAEYELLYGGSAPQKMEVYLDTNNAFVGAKKSNGMMMYDSLQLFYANGGGNCYIVSVGSYVDPLDKNQFIKGLKILELEDEPTILIFPDAVNLSKETDLYDIQVIALQQCAKLMDRVTLCDLIHSNDFHLNVQSFRDKIGVNNLKYGMAYGPWINASLGRFLYHKDLTFKRDDTSGSTISLDSLVPQELQQILFDLKNAEDSVSNLSAGKLDLTAGLTTGTLEAKLKSLSDSFENTTGTTLADFETPLQDLYAFIPAVISKIKTITDLLPAIVSAPSTINETKEFNLKGIIDQYMLNVGSQMDYDKLIAHHKQLNPSISLFAGAPGSCSTEFMNTISMLNYLPAITGTDATSLFSNVSLNVAPEYTSAGSDEKLKAIVAKNAALKAGQAFINFYNFVQDSASEYEKKFNEAILSSFSFYKNLVDKAIESLNILPPSGAIAGVYASVDRDRGVWKAPANVSLNSVIGPAVKISHEQQGEYNVDVNAGKSINIIRSFTGKGTLVWGARTLAGNDNEWRYIPVRRLFNMVEESVKKATEQFVFEPNDANTWVRVQAMIENFLNTLWRQGALQGVKPEHAFYVAVGLGKTMTSLDILEGRMIIEIGMAAVRPAEFIILRFSHKMAES